MIHKLHSDTGDYFASNRDYGHVHYPQPISNCLTCHDNNRMPKPAGRTASDAVAFQERPSAKPAAPATRSTSSDGGFNHLFAVRAGLRLPDLPWSGHRRSRRWRTSTSALLSTPNNPVQRKLLVFEYQIASVDAERQPAGGDLPPAGERSAGQPAEPARWRGPRQHALLAAWSVAHPGDSLAGPADRSTAGLQQPWHDCWSPVVGQQRDAGLRHGRAFLGSAASQLGNVSAAAILNGLTPAAMGNGYFTTVSGHERHLLPIPAGATLMAIGIEGLSRPRRRSASTRRRRSWSVSVTNARATARDC
jgi:hypothetical protein